jgi:hypothetical protein
MGSSNSAEKTPTPEEQAEYKRRMYELSHFQGTNYFNRKTSIARVSPIRLINPQRSSRADSMMFAGSVSTRPKYNSLPNIHKGPSEPQPRRLSLQPTPLVQDKSKRNGGGVGYYTKTSLLAPPDETPDRENTINPAKTVMVNKGVQWMPKQKTPETMPFPSPLKPASNSIGVMTEALRTKEATTFVATRRRQRSYSQDASTNRSLNLSHKPEVNRPINNPMAPSRRVAVERTPYTHGQPNILTKPVSVAPRRSSDRGIDPARRASKGYGPAAPTNSNKPYRSDRGQKRKANDEMAGESQFIYPASNNHTRKYRHGVLPSERMNYHPSWEE